MDSKLEKFAGSGWRSLTTHCPKGHGYTPENTRWRSLGGGLQRQCRTCERERQQAYRDREKGIKMNERLDRAMDKLVNAIERVQDWNGTRVGDALEELAAARTQQQAPSIEEVYQASHVSYEDEQRVAKDPAHYVRLLGRKQFQALYPGIRLPEQSD